MTETVTLTLRLFGALREHGESVTVTVPKGASVAQVKAALHASLAAPEPLIDDSALADEREVLPESAIFAQDAELAILPPVCGG